MKVKNFLHGRRSCRSPCKKNEDAAHRTRGTGPGPGVHFSCVISGISNTSVTPRGPLTWLQVSRDGPALAQPRWRHQLYPSASLPCWFPATYRYVSSVDVISTRASPCYCRSASRFSGSCRRCGAGVQNRAAKSIRPPASSSVALGGRAGVFCLVRFFLCQMCS